jgi:glycoprotein endo-alpha-1,2-mannosidase
MADYPSSRIPRQAWAYYHPFYGTPEGPTGRWLTWNEPLWLAEGYGAPSFDAPPAVRDRLRHDPSTFVGPGRRACYSAFYPTLGLYDSLDPTVLEQHARWAVEASLDGLLWDYMLVGEDNPDKDKPLSETIYDRSFRAMLEAIRRTGAPLTLAPFYDSFGWYGFPPEKIAEQLEYLVKTYRGHPAALHFDGRLAVFLYSTVSRLGFDDWRRIRSMLAAQGLDDRIFLVAGELVHLEPEAIPSGLFDGFSLYNFGMEDWTAGGVRRGAEKLALLRERAGARFHAATLGPGFDGRVWHHPGRAVARGLGKRYESMWEAAIAACPDFITICSFNEWGEGTQIEPCLEYEDLYLKLTAKWARAFREGA